MTGDERVARSVALEQAYVHDVYEQFYDNPRSKPWPKVQQFLDELEPGSIVCDVGCGNGKYLTLNSTIATIGGDISQRMAETAREKSNEVLILNNLNLPYRDDSLDAILSIAVVHHLATTDRRICALRELARVLRIGGRLIISVWAMEQSHRKFESQDVLVPWHRTKHLMQTPSLELTSTTITSEDDFQPIYNAYTQSDSDSNRSNRIRGVVRKKAKQRKGLSIDPARSSPSSSSLSSPNETCYSFVRRAIQKLAGGTRRRRPHRRPWLPDAWTTCARQPPPPYYDPDGCECADCDVHDLPIELRRVDDDAAPAQRRRTLPASQLCANIPSSLKSKSMTSIYPQKELESNHNTLPEVKIESRPRLVKQKQSICEDDEEALDQPTVLPNETKIQSQRYQKGVFKQRSLNEELMSTDRLKEKEWVRRNIQKQASLNEDLIYHRFDSFKDTLLSVSSSKRFQLIKTGFTNKLKNSSTIEKVTKNGFVRLFQNWKSTELTSPTINELQSERRSSKEDGSDSSKDSSLQSDTSVDSEDSFASVIFIPKSDPLSPTATLSPISPRLKSTSMPISSRIKQSSCPTSPRIKQMPLTVYPLIKQLSSPKPKTDSLLVDTKLELIVKPIVKKNCLAKYSVPQIPKYKPIEREGKEQRLVQIKQILAKKPGFGTKPHFPIVRHSSLTNGRVEVIAKPLPKLLTLELFNPETDDKDSDSSCVSSPDSFESIKHTRKIKFSTKHNNLIERTIGGALSTELAPLFETGDCHRHLTNFADRLSEKLLAEIDQYKSREGFGGFNDPYIYRLSEELDDLSKLSAEIQKQNEYLVELSVRDDSKKCKLCGAVRCRCVSKRTKNNSINEVKKRIESVHRSKTNESIESTVKLIGKPDSYDSDKGSSTNSMGSSVATSINYESTDGSTASLTSCPEWKNLNRSRFEERLSLESESGLVNNNTKGSLMTDTSQDSLPSDNIGGEITYHRYYHVFREGELDQLIEKYVENLHIISSYYDHASWCIIAEKVQVWTI